MGERSSYHPPSAAVLSDCTHPGSAETPPCGSEEPTETDGRERPLLTMDERREDPREASITQMIHRDW